MSPARIFGAALLAATLLASRGARADDPDPWFGKDKALHFGASATIAAAGYAIGTGVFDARRDALLLGGGLAALAGIGKETLDLAGYGDPSWKDLTWDGIGTVFGLLVAWGLDMAIRGVSDRHPALAAPHPSAVPAGASGVRIAF